jgi:S-DNA-T family DNA segregation ATPase FtsK/SpoIIIE
MTTTIVRRPPRRRAAPKIESADFPMQEPPGLPETQSGSLSQLLMYLPMGASSAVMMLVFIQPGQNRLLMYLASGLMAVSMVAMGMVQLAKAGTDRKQRLAGERRDYLRYLGQVRKVVRQAVDKQRESVLFTHPDPARLWTLATPGDLSRLWERRTTHPDFAEVRIGLGEQRLAMKLQPPQTKPVEDLEPLCASALRRFLKAYNTVGDVPIAVYLRGFARIHLEGDAEVARGMVRAILAQLVTLHAPDDLRVAVCASTQRLTHWDWVKWLPHAQHPTEVDALGPVRLISDAWSDLDGLLGAADGGEEDRLDQRARFEAGAEVTAQEPFVLVVVDGGEVAHNARLAAAGYRNVLAIDIIEESGDPGQKWGSDGAGALPLPAPGDKLSLRLRLSPNEVQNVRLDRRRNEKTTRLGRSDQLSLVRARALARLLAPYRMVVAAEQAGPGAFTGNVDLLALLGAGDAETLAPTALWQGRSVWDNLRVPIGVNERGEPIELDLKESAQGGMGPHGILIGATGSGKSETIRTLVLALALTHSSEKLNMVLVDFKGGATFLGLEHLPHVSAFITNLSDELPLVDRMQDALQGELVRRQELLRAAGHPSLTEYEKARANGAALAPLPTLVIIVDEFGELLATQPEFMDLFVMIGRLGRSLGVHLLLASQRLEEGRIHQLETHLSYRIGLRVFSAMESRSIIGTSDAYDQPLQPGSGYLRTSTTSLEKFKGAYVSAPYRTTTQSGARRTPSPAAHPGLLPFVPGYVAPAARSEPEPAAEQQEQPGETAEVVADSATETLLQFVVSRLRDAGPAAHAVWLPPLTTPATLDELLPVLRVDPQRGFGVRIDGLKVPMGLIDRPFEQRRDLLVADLGGGKGHMAVVGAPQMGKTTVLRTLIAGLALTNTPREVQFYLLDFGGGGLSTLAKLPHVGSAAGRLDRERVNRTLSEVTNLLAHREAAFQRQGIESMSAYRKARARGEHAGDPYGDVFLVIDGWFTFRQEYDAHESRIQEIATRGLTYGVHLMISSTRWSEIRPWLRDMTQTRFELRLGDPTESEIDFRVSKSVPEVPGRGLTPDKYHYLTALPRVDGGAMADVGEAVADLVERVRGAWHGPAAPQVRLLPTQMSVTDLPVPEGDLRVAIGVDEERLAPLWHDFSATPHLFAFGDTETGKSNLLRLIAKAIVSRFSPDEARIICADPRRQLQDSIPAAYQLAYTFDSTALKDVIKDAAAAMRKRIPGADIPPDRLAKRDWWNGPRLFVLMDDYDLLSSTTNYPAEGLVELIAQGAPIGLHVVVARTTSHGMRGMMDPVIRRMWETGTPGLLFSCRRDEGTFMGDAKPQTLPPGRAQLVDRRRVRLIQTGFVPPPAETQPHDGPLPPDDVSYLRTA